MRISGLFASEYHPVVLRPEQGGDTSFEALSEFLAVHPLFVTELLQQHGGVLLRGVQVDSAERFNLCAEKLGGTPFGYAGGNSPRKHVAGDVFTSTEYPASETISLHHEMSYLEEWPARLFFHCSEPAARGGQTSLAHSRDVHAAMPDAIKSIFRDKQICYIRHFHSGINIGKSWQSTYGTESRAGVEQILESQKSTWHWDTDGSLRVNTVCSAFATPPGSDSEIWFNQAEQWHPSSLHPQIRSMLQQAKMLSHDCTFGDGDAISDDLLAQVRSVLNANKLLFDWQKHDVLIIDNMLMMHGRESFSGIRKTLAYLSST